MLVVHCYILLNSKLIRWNNDGYMYVGNSNNQLVKLANYTDITNIKQAIIGQYTGTESGYNKNKNIILGFQPSYVFVCVTNITPSGGYFAVTNTTFSNIGLSLITNGFSVTNIRQTSSDILLNVINYNYIYLCFA